MGSSPHLEKHGGWCSLCGVRCAVAGGAVCRQFKSSSSARPCLSCLSTGDSASRRTRNMPDKKWQKQTDEDECRQILRASAENERNATVCAWRYKIRPLGQHQHQHCHNFRSTQRRQNSCVYISTHRLNYCHGRLHSYPNIFISGTTIRL